MSGLEVVSNSAMACAPLTFLAAANGSMGRNLGRPIRLACASPEQLFIVEIRRGCQTDQAGNAVGT